VIRVLIADDNAVIRHGLRSLLEASDDIRVVGEASNGKQALAVAREVRPDVVLLDVRMPVTDGVTAAAILSEQHPVMMLTYADDREVVTSAIRAGARGYLVHGRFSAEELEDAVRRVAAGEAVLSPAVTALVFDALRSEPEVAIAPEAATGLTEREQDVMTLIARGRANREIADELYLSEKTVKNHINNIYAKLGVSTRSEAMAKWLGTSEATA
jgi:DNA-binding NarL/FixJ family response regulator